MTDLWSVARLEFEEAAEGTADEFIAVLQTTLSTQGAYEDVQAKGVISWRIFFEPEDLPPNLAEVVASQAEQFGIPAPRVAEIEVVKRENWNDAWRQFFHPVRISPRMEVRPSWFKDLPAGGGSLAVGSAGAEAGAAPDIIIYIEPGMAFGTGTHATTQLCLRLAEALVLPGSHVLDAGTGSGILAIAACKLGARLVRAFDLDPDVEENLRLNLVLNDVPQGQVELTIGGLDRIPAVSFDLIFCNMLSKEFLPLLPAFPAYMKGGGRLLLSGLLVSEQEDVSSAVKDAGLQIVSEEADGEWAAIVCGVCGV